MSGAVSLEPRLGRGGAAPADVFAPSERMSGAERAGLVVALAGHALLFALLSTGWSKPPAPPVPTTPPIEVSLVKEVTLEATAPPTVAPPAPSVAPDVGDPEDAAPAAPPPAPPEATPEPAVKPEPVKPAPAQPAPKPVKADRVAAAKPSPPPKPVPVARPAVVKPAAKPQPAAPAKLAAAAKPRPAAPAKVATAAKVQPAAAKPVARSSRLTGLGSSLAAGAKADATAPRARGRRLGDDIVAGLSADAPRRPAPAAAPGAKPGPFPTASIQQAIARQIQPCADRQVNPGPGANRIVTTLNIRLNPDGTLAATPRMVRQGGTDGENERYAQRVVDLGIAAFRGCTPLRLPADYYQTAAGGWSVLNYQWQLR